MRILVLTLLLLFGAVAVADPPLGPLVLEDDPGGPLVEQEFLRQYALGVQRLPMDGGKIYGWKIGNDIAIGRFKGENDEFGVSVDLNSRQRIEITTDGLRWRKALGGGR